MDLYFHEMNMLERIDAKNDVLSPLQDLALLRKTNTSSALMSGGGGSRKRPRSGMLAKSDVCKHL